MQEANPKRDDEQVMWGHDERRTLVWMALSLGASLGLAINVLYVFGLRPGLYIALAATARLAFLLYLPAYVGGPLVSLFGDAFLPIRKHARDFGLAFAAAILVHLGLVNLPLRDRIPAAGKDVRRFWPRRGLHLPPRASFSSPCTPITA